MAAARLDARQRFLLRAEARRYAPQDQAAHLCRHAHWYLSLDERRHDLDEGAQWGSGEWLHGSGHSVLPGGQAELRLCFVRHIRPGDRVAGA